jgi:flagellar basal-body rod protein FlgF
VNRGIFTVTSGALGALARLDAAAQNLANINTAGYKAERPTFRLQAQDKGASSGLDPILARTGGVLIEVERVRDFSQGPIQQTGNPLDLAISGDGFFVVNTDRGERYTRKGTLQVDGEGFLTTSSGDRVQGTGGDLEVKGSRVVVAGDGTFTVDGNTVGQLKLVGFGKTPGLVPEGDGLFKAAPDVQPVPVDGAEQTITQGAVEGSNLDAVTGMVELVDVSRAYEQYMKALERLDQLTQKSISEVGRVG